MKRPQYDEYDPWATYNPDAPVMRRHRRRIRKPTLTNAIREARKLGVVVSGATMTADGVSLSFGEERNARLNGNADETVDELRKLI